MLTGLRPDSLWHLEPADTPPPAPPGHRHAAATFQEQRLLHRSVLARFSTTGGRTFMVTRSRGVCRNSCTTRVTTMTNRRIEGKPPGKRNQTAAQHHPRCAGRGLFRRPDCDPGHRVASGVEKKQEAVFFGRRFLETASAVQRPKALLEPVRPGQGEAAGIIGQAGKRS